MKKLIVLSLVAGIATSATTATVLSTINNSTTTSSGNKIEQQNPGSNNNYVENNSNGSIIQGGQSSSNQTQVTTPTYPSYDSNNSQNQTQLVNKFAYSEVSLFNVSENIINNELSYKITLTNSVLERGSVVFIQGNEELTTITARPGDTVTLKVTANDGYTVRQVNVYGESESIKLGVESNGNSLYSFVIPQPTITDPITGQEMDHPFQVGEDGVHVSVEFIQSSFGQWTFEYNTDGLGTYILNLSGDTLLDDSIQGLALQSIIDGAKNISYQINLNGHDIIIGKFTIPSTSNLILNNTTNTKSTIRAELYEANCGLLDCRGQLTINQTNIVFSHEVKNQYGLSWLDITSR